jgi:hypothetical protein
MDSTIYLDVMLCSAVVYLSFGGTYCLHLQLVNFYQTTQRHIAKDSNTLHNHRRENLKSNIPEKMFVLALTLPLQTSVRK